MFTLTKAITLYSLTYQFHSINNLLPKDTEYDKTKERHRRFYELLVPVIVRDLKCTAQAKFIEKIKKD